MTATPLKLVAGSAAADIAAARPLLWLAGISKTFNNGVTALAGIDLIIRPGEFGYMLRCYFDGCRRAIALESALLMLLDPQGS